jgi:hypothetical protein
VELVKLVAGGIGGGAIGAAIWAAIGHFTGYEVGWIAWGVGGLVGLGVRTFGATEMASFDRSTRQRVVRRVPAVAPAMAGIIAAVIAIGSVVGGKYLVVRLALSDMLANAPEIETSEAMIASLADQIVFEREEAGQSVTFPPGKEFETAARQGDYPPGLWSEAEARWTSMSPEEQRELSEGLVAMREAFVGSIGTGAIVASSFGLFDLLWFGLAGWTAFKLGMSIEE